MNKSFIASSALILLTLMQPKAIAEVVPVSVNAPSRIFYPIRESGDCETGKDPYMDASAELIVTRDRRQIYVDIEYYTYEHDHDQSSARVIDRELLWTAPEGWRIKQILGDTYWSVSRLVDSSRNTANDYNPGSTSPWFFRLQARTLGTDFADCGPPPHSYMQLVPKGSMQIEVDLERR